jgi:hypothetical protein
LATFSGRPAGAVEVDSNPELGDFSVKANYRGGASAKRAAFT